jgi:hypothetical protein
MTSIEFLEQNVTLNISVYDWLLLIQQAKEMHKAERISVLEEIISRLEEDGLYALQGIKHTLENLKK